jgi:hypothetical protein
VYAWKRRQMRLTASIEYSKEHARKMSRQNSEEAKSRELALGKNFYFDGSKMHRLSQDSKRTGSPSSPDGIWPSEGDDGGQQASEDNRPRGGWRRWRSASPKWWSASPKRAPSPGLSGVPGASLPGDGDEVWDPAADWPETPCHAQDEGERSPWHQCDPALWNSERHLTRELTREKTRDRSPASPETFAKPQFLRRSSSGYKRLSVPDVDGDEIQNAETGAAEGRSFLSRFKKSQAARPKRTDPNRSPPAELRSGAESAESRFEQGVRAAPDSKPVPSGFEKHQATWPNRSPPAELRSGTQSAETQVEQGDRAAPGSKSFLSRFTKQQPARPNRSPSAEFHDLMAAPKRNRHTRRGSSPPAVVVARTVKTDASQPMAMQRDGPSEGRSPPGSEPDDEPPRAAAGKRKLLR